MCRELAVAYAAYLDTDFYLFMIRVFLAWGDGSLTPAPDREAAPLDAKTLTIELREELAKEIAEVRQSLAADIAELRQGIAESWRTLMRRLDQGDNFGASDHSRTRRDVRKAKDSLAESLARTLSREEAGHLVDSALAAVSDEFRELERRLADGPASRRPASADQEARWQALVEAWWMAFGSQKKRAGEIALIAGGSILPGKGFRGRTMALAHWAAKNAGEWFRVEEGALRVKLRVEPEGRGKLYQLNPRASPGQPA